MRCSCMQYRKNKDGIGYTSYPCGQCIACRLNKVRDWTIRLMHERKFHKDAVFLTLTYDNEHLPENGSLCKQDLQLFMKRLRKKVGKVRFFACGEYGEKFSRPHYHLIIYGISEKNSIFKGKKYDQKSKGYYLLSPLWKNGNMYIGDVNYHSCRYVASYVNKKFMGDKRYLYDERGVIPEFTLMSRRPGIGAEFVNFTSQCSNVKKQLYSEVAEVLCHVFMRTKFLIPQNCNQCEKLKNELLELLQIATLKHCKEKKTIKQKYL